MLAHDPKIAHLSHGILGHRRNLIWVRDGRQRIQQFIDLRRVEPGEREVDAPLDVCEEAPQQVVFPRRLVLQAIVGDKVCVCLCAVQRQHDDGHFREAHLSGRLEARVASQHETVLSGQHRVCPAELGDGSLKFP